MQPYTLPQIAPFTTALRRMGLPTPTAPNVSGVQLPSGIPALSRYPMYSSLNPSGVLESGGRGGPGAGQGTGEFGPLSGQFSSMLGGVRSGLGLGAMAAGLLGATTLGSVLGGFGQVAGFLGLSSTIAGLLGAVPGFDMSLGMPTETDFRDVRDYEGAFKEAAARAQAAQDMNDRVNARQNELDMEGMRGGWGNPGPAAGYGGAIGGDPSGIGAGGPSPGGNASTGSRGDE